MGQKVHPTGYRLGVTTTWQSRWFADKHKYSSVLKEDRLLRDTVNKVLANAGVARIEIERPSETQVELAIFTSKPGLVIGKNGEGIERLRVQLDALTGKKVHPKVMEIKKPELEAVLVGKSIAEQIEKRIAPKRAMKQAVQRAMRSNALGIKIICSGRLGGADIARSERDVDGSVPLHTLRADIDFAIVEAHTTYGVIGIKVWVHRETKLAARQSTRQYTRDSQSDTPRSERPPRRDGARRSPQGGDHPRGERSADGGARQRPPRNPQGGTSASAPRGDRGPRRPRTEQSASADMNVSAEHTQPITPAPAETPKPEE